MTIPDHRHDLRGGTAAEWTATNPVLEAKELGLETDTGRLKIGDGETAWNDLDYWLSPDVTTAIAAAIGEALDDEPTLLQTVAWAADTDVPAKTLVQLPTGGLAYQTVDYTTRASFDATERAAWTFIPGGHYEKITSSGSWTVPTGISRARVRLIAAGAGGNGGGAATTSGGTATQVGGPGGGAGECIDRDIAFASSTCTATVGAGGSGGTGGAANNHPGGSGTPGGDTTFTDGTTTLTARGGGAGTPSLGNSAANAFGGGMAASWDTTGVTAGGAVIPGGGAFVTPSFGYPTIPAGPVAGGGGGAPAAAGKGGLGGAVGAGIGSGTGAAGLKAGGGSANSTGGAGSNAAFPGHGGGGGGGGAPGGAGGNGGSGANGQIEVWF